MTKHNAKNLGKHFFWFHYTPICRHDLALAICLISLFLAIVFLFGTPSYLAYAAVLAALVSFYFYREWKKELEADVGTKRLET